jgi:hypothetical protein
VGEETDLAASCDGFIVAVVVVTDDGLSEYSEPMKLFIGAVDGI